MKSFRKINFKLPSKYILYCLCVVTFFFIVGVFSLTPHISPAGDNISYIKLSEALVEGHGYVNTIYPGDPIESQYPPLFPVFLTFILYFAGINIFYLKIVPLFFGIVSLPVIFILFKETAGEKKALYITALTATSSIYLDLSTKILSESLYVFLSMLTLLTINRVEKKGWNAWSLPIVSFLIVLTCYTRTVGVSLGLAVICYLLLKKRIKALLIIILMIVALFGWWGNRVIQHKSTYISQLTEDRAEEDYDGHIKRWSGRIVYNITRYSGKVIAELFGGYLIEQVSPYQPIKIISSLIISLLTCIGYVIVLRNGITIGLLYVFLYLGIYAIWPYHGTRFLVPIYPFIIFYFLIGLETVTPFGLPVRAYAIKLIMAILVIGGIVSCIHLNYRNKIRYYDTEMERYREACMWIKKNTTAESIIFCRKPRLAAFWTGRKTWLYGGPLQSFEIKVNNRYYEASYLIVNNFPIAGVNLAELMKNVEGTITERLVMVFQTGDPQVIVYKID